MRCTSSARSTLRCARLERCEDRLLLSTTPWADSSVAPAYELTSFQPDCVELAPTIEPTAATTAYAAPAEYVRNTYGFYGAGQTVAIIDSGIAWDHVALGGGFGEGFQVVGGWDFTEENDADPYDDGPAGFHGTHVAGIVGAQDETYTGVAPRVDLVGLRVFNDQGLGYSEWVEQALSWVHDHRNDFRFPITTVNLSFGARWNGSAPPSWSIFEEELALLARDGIFVSAAAGNSFADYGEAGLAYPAASPHVVPVASVGENGSLSDYSQRHERVLAAPGELITSSVPDHIFGADGDVNDWATVSGTSMAAPYLAGASVLIREAMQFLGRTSITQTEIYEHLRNTSDLVFDPVTDAYYHRLNMARAVDAIMPADDFSSSLDAPFELGRLPRSQSVSGQLARLDDRDVFQFTAPASGEISWESTGRHAFHVTLLSESRQVLSEENSSSVRVTAGETYTLVVSAGESVTDYDLHLSFTRDQLVTVDGNVVRFNGTSADDTICFWIDDQYRLDVNGQQYSYDRDVAWQFEIQGGGGHDRVTLSGSALSDTVVLRPGSAELSGPGYALIADNFPRITVLAAAGLDDVAHIFGSDGNDRFVASPSNAFMSGDGYLSRAEGFDRVYAYARSGGNDIAQLYDSAGNDEFIGRPGDGSLRGTGYFIGVTDFDRVYAYASSGHDTAQLFDSEGNDVFIGTPSASWMQGNRFFCKTWQFDRVYALASRGYDTARLYDSRGDELFVGTPDASWLQGDSFYYKAGRFDRVHAYAFDGGHDEARFHGSTDEELCAGMSDAPWMQGDAFFYKAWYFDRVQAHHPGVNESRVSTPHNQNELADQQAVPGGQPTERGGPGGGEPRGALPPHDVTREPLADEGTGGADVATKELGQNRSETVMRNSQAADDSDTGSARHSRALDARLDVQLAEFCESSGAIEPETEVAVTARHLMHERDRVPTAIDSGLLGDLYLAALDELFENLDSQQFSHAI